MKKQCGMESRLEQMKKALLFMESKMETVD